VPLRRQPRHDTATPAAITTTCGRADRTRAPHTATTGPATPVNPAPSSEHGTSAERGTTAVCVTPYPTPRTTTSTAHPLAGPRTICGTGAGGSSPRAQCHARHTVLTSPAAQAGWAAITSAVPRRHVHDTASSPSLVPVTRT